MNTGSGGEVGRGQRAGVQRAPTTGNVYRQNMHNWSESAVKAGTGWANAQEEGTGSEVGRGRRAGVQTAPTSRDLSREDRHSLSESAADTGIAGESAQRTSKQVLGMYRGQAGTVRVCIKRAWMVILAMQSWVQVMGVGSDAAQVDTGGEIGKSKERSAGVVIGWMKGWGSITGLLSSHTAELGQSTSFEAARQTTQVETGRPLMQTMPDLKNTHLSSPAEMTEEAPPWLPC